MNSLERTKVYTLLTKIEVIIAKNGITYFNKSILSQVNSVSDVEKIIDDLIDKNQEKNEIIDELNDIQKEVTPREVEDQAVIINDSHEISSVDPILINRSVSAIDSLRNTCLKNNIDAYVANASDSDYGVDTFSMRVSATNQATIDSILAQFARSGCEIRFTEEANFTFNLEITNRNNLVPTEQLFEEINYSINSAREDIDYLENVPDEVKLLQVEFMIEHPQVIDSYDIAPLSFDTINDTAETITEIVSTGDNLGVSSDEIITGSVVVTAGVVLAGKFISDSANVVNTLSEINVLKAVNVVEPINKINVVSNEIAGIITYIRDDSLSNGSFVDIVVKPSIENDQSVNIIVNDPNNEKNRIMMSCDKKEFSQVQDDLNSSFDMNTIRANSNSDGSVNMQVSTNNSNDKSTFTVIATDKTNIINIIKKNTKSNIPVKVYSNSNLDREGFTNAEILLAAFAAVSIIFGFIISYII